MYISVLETWYLWYLFKISAKGGGAYFKESA